MSLVIPDSRLTSASVRKPFSSEKKIFSKLSDIIVRMNHAVTSLTCDVMILMILVNASLRKYV